MNSDPHVRGTYKKTGAKKFCQALSEEPSRCYGSYAVQLIAKKVHGTKRSWKKTGYVFVLVAGTSLLHDGPATYLWQEG